MIGSLMLVLFVGYVCGDGQITVARPIIKRGVPWISDGFSDFGSSGSGGWPFGGGSSFGSAWA